MARRLRRRSKQAKLNIGPDLDLDFTFVQLCEAAQDGELSLLSQALSGEMEASHALRRDLEGRISHSEVLARAVRAHASSWREQYPELYEQLSTRLKEEWEERRREEEELYGSKPNPRKPKVRKLDQDREQIEEWVEEGKSKTWIAEELGVTYETVRRFCTSEGLVPSES